MKLRNILAASALLAATVPAFAAVTVFDFSNLKYEGRQNTGLLPSGVLGTDYWGCTGGDICSSNIDHKILGGDLVYTVNGISATATAQYQSGSQSYDATVVQDHENGYSAANKIGAGLGVYHKAHDNSDDNITRGEQLTLTFAGPVNLSSVMLRSDGHDTSWKRNATFLLNGTSYKLDDTIAPAALTGSVFTFQFGGAKPDQFYLGGVTVSAVPEPSSYAMLLAGVGLMAFVARRRKTQA
ncbi:MAG TPA: FxDxF family PEP-CTERM protein [Burkholderiaceae bacterium]|nr:FxDxF family PEP-CTERM protein [Burkholderiaceae bacterium]